MKKLFLLSVAAFSLGGVAAGARAVIIDNFDIPVAPSQLGMVDPCPGSVSTTGATTDIIGGQRDVSCSVLGSTAGGTSVFGARFGDLQGGNEPGNTAQFDVVWDNNGSGLGGVDLLANGEDRLRFQVISSDIRDGFWFTITVEDTSGGTAVYSGLSAGSTPTTGWPVAGGPYDFDILISAAINLAGTCTAASPTNCPKGWVLGGGATDTASVFQDSNYVSLGITTIEEDADFRIGLLETVVPEPTALSLMGLGIAALGFRARRRRS
jgi:hypothetical protein